MGSYHTPTVVLSPIDSIVIMAYTVSFCMTPHSRGAKLKGMHVGGKNTNSEVLLLELH